MFVNELLTGIGRRLFQRLMLILVIAVALRTVGFFMGPGDDGTFRSTSSQMRPASDQSSADEDDLWGSGTKGKNNRSDRARDSSRPPVYDPVEDGGWGAN